MIVFEEKLVNKKWRRKKGSLESVNSKVSNNPKQITITL